MKIFFMDIDGPMLPEKSYSLPENQTQRIKFDDYAVEFVNYFLNNDFQLVISSAWQVAGKEYISDLLRYNKINPEKLHTNWCTDIYTEKIPAPVEKGYYERYEEIQLWLDNNKTDVYIAIDDEDIGQLKGGIICSFKEGLNNEHFKTAIEISKNK